MQLAMDERFMPTAARAQPITKRRLWIGRAFTEKFTKPAPVVEGFARLGFPVALSLSMTGYLSDAVASQL